MTAQQRAVLGAVVAAIIGFAIGAGWQYSSARGYAGDLDTTRQELDTTTRDLGFQRLEATLGAATIEAQRGSHEIARQLVSDFFTGLQTHVAEAPPAAQPEFQQILQQRDAMITSLSRGDPQSGALLAQIFVRYRIAMGEPVGPNAGAAPAPAAADSPTTTTGM